MTHLNHWSSLLLPVAPDVPLAPKANLAVTSKRETRSKYGNLFPKIVFLDAYVTGPQCIFLYIISKKPTDPTRRLSSSSTLPDFTGSTVYVHHRS